MEGPGDNRRHAFAIRQEARACRQHEAVARRAYRWGAVGEGVVSAAETPLLQVEDVDGELVLCRRVGGGNPEKGAIVELRAVPVVDLEEPRPLSEAGRKAGWE